LVECGRHLNIKLLTLTEIEELTGEVGNFTVTLRKKPRYVDMDKCIGCGVCAEKCPRKVSDEYNLGLNKRKAIYIKYSQTVPLKFVIDPDNCIYFKKGTCKACEKFCPSGAINLDDQEEILTVQVGAVVLATGFTPFNPAVFDTYGYGKYPGVVTGLEFERILSASGPFAGHVVRPSDKKEPRKIAWLQCVGSRDTKPGSHSYCSGVCCMYAIKQAVIAKEHAGEDLETVIFFMDMRTYGKDFDRFYQKAEHEAGVRFVRSRVHSLSPAQPDSNDIRLEWVDDDGNLREEIFDLVVLSIGLEAPGKFRQLSERLGIELDGHGFTATTSFAPVAASRPGIYVCGAAAGPKDIPYSVMEASAAAAAAAGELSSARFSLVTEKTYPPERDVSWEKPRIGVFVCNCGINIGSVVKVPEVAEYARSLPHVVYVEENLYTCSQDTQDKLSEVIQEHGLNRVVVAACSPRTHEPLFQETMNNAGLNKYLFEMANIRNHDSWVHAQEPEVATQKAKALVAMAVAKSALLNPLKEADLPVTQAALVVGGGVAGMSAALNLAQQGYPVHLVEQTAVLGGNARQLLRTYRGEDIGAFRSSLEDQISREPKITVHLTSTITGVDGFVGNFNTTITNGSSPTTISHGVAVLATGAKESKPQEYLYGKHPAVVTQLEFDEMMRQKEPQLTGAETIAFIQCVGSREESRPYCSKVCCTHSVKGALELLENNPDAGVYVLYRDMRTYGDREDLYHQARDRGVIFNRYTQAEKPLVTAHGEKLRVECLDHVLRRPLAIEVDLLVLAAAIESHRDQALAQMYRVPLDADGWFLEAHQKLRPVDFANDGVFLCGMAHYPKPLEESVAQAQAAAARAATVLSKGSIKAGGLVSRITPEFCCGCQICVNVCPYQAIAFNEEQGVAQINEVLCKGCGACAAACPCEAPVLLGFNNRQLYAQINSSLRFS
jgi:heterodisulfide reductase subunit A2